MLTDKLKEIGCTERSRYFLRDYEVYFFGGLAAGKDNTEVLFLGVLYKDEPILRRKIELNITANEMKDILLEVIPASYFTGS